MYVADVGANSGEGW